MNRRQAIKRTAYILGYAVSASAVAGVLNGCRAENIVDWEPQFLTAEQAAALKAATEGILPASDTPGANDVGVHQFIDTMLQECLAEEERTIMAQGLNQLDADCREAYGKAYAQCSGDQQTEILTKYDRAAHEYNQSGGTDKPFFTLLKELTVLGYFTSEKVGEEVMAYDPIPDTYEGCIPWEAGRPDWSL